jgi:hypothetical protein
LIGEEFKEKIIPRAVDYFTGKALEYEDFEEESDFEVIIIKTNKQTNTVYLLFILGRFPFRGRRLG